MTVTFPGMGAGGYAAGMEGICGLLGVMVIVGIVAALRRLNRRFDGS